MSAIRPFRLASMYPRKRIQARTVNSPLDDASTTENQLESKTDSNGADLIDAETRAKTIAVVHQLLFPSSSYLPPSATPTLGYPSLSRRFPKTHQKSMAILPQERKSGPQTRSDVRERKGSPSPKRDLPQNQHPRHVQRPFSSITPEAEAIIDIGRLDGTTNQKSAVGTIFSQAWETFSWDQLAFESAVSSPLKSDGKTEESTRLVDNQTEALNLWPHLLRFRYRVYGDRGIDEVWSGIVSRKARLPSNLSPVNIAIVDDESAVQESEYLWQQFVRRIPLEELVEYAEQQMRHNGGGWSTLFALSMERVIEEQLRRNSGEQDTLEKLKRWHSRFSSYHIPKGAVVGIALKFSGKGNADGVRVVRKWYSQLWNSDMLDGLEISNRDRMSLLRSLRKAGLFQEEKEWLSFFRKIGAERTMGREDDSESAWLSAVLAPERGLGSSRAAGKSWINDDLITRLFATRGLSISTIASGLGLLAPGGRLGALPVQELAARFSTEPARFLEAVQKLRQNGIGLESNIYTTALIQTASSVSARSVDMFYRLALSSDLAQPSVLHALDETISYALMNSSADALPAVFLSAISAGQKETIVATWNAFLSYQASSLRTTAAVAVAENMLALRIPVEVFSMEKLAECCLGPRIGAKGTRDEVIRLPPLDDPKGVAREERSREAAERDVKLLVKLWRGIQESGRECGSEAENGVPPRLWANVIKRLGGLGLWSDMEVLILWLAEWYGKSVQAERTGAESPSARNSGEEIAALKEIFPLRVQQAIVVWGFRGWLARETSGEADKADEDTEDKKMTYPEWNLIARFEAVRRQADAEPEAEVEAEVKAKAEEETEAELEPLSEAEPLDDDVLDEVEENNELEEADPFADQPGPSAVASLTSPESGFATLHRLQDAGLRIKMAAVGKAIRQVLWTTYGVGCSARGYGQVARTVVPRRYKLEELLAGYSNGLAPFAVTATSRSDAVFKAGQIAQQIVSRTRLAAQTEAGWSEEERCWGKAEVEALRRGMVFTLFSLSPAVAQNPAELQGPVMNMKTGEWMTVYPARRRRSRIPEMIWRRAVERWAVNGEGELEHWVGMELMDGAGPHHSAD